MKILVLLYNNFVAFELTIATHLLNGMYEIVTAAPEVGPVRDMGGLRFAPDYQLDQINPEDYKALIIPGGLWEELLQNTQVSDLIKNFAERGAVIGAICAAPVHLANAGILSGHVFTTTLTDQAAGGNLFNWEGYLEQDLVIDGSIITAKGNAFIEFGVALADKLGRFTDKGQRDEVYERYKSPRYTAVSLG